MKIVILDRDGVINEDSPEFVKSVAEWRPIPGSLEAIARLCQAGFRVFIATNQSGIGRGLFDYDAFAAINAHIQKLLAELGGREVGETDHMVTETLIRGMYDYWRKVMESPEPSATPEARP